jgi:hypothetical protein
VGQNREAGKGQEVIEVLQAKTLLAADERRLTPITQECSYRRSSAFIGGSIVWIGVSVGFV